MIISAIVYFPEVICISALVKTYKKIRWKIEKAYIY